MKRPAPGSTKRWLTDVALAWESDDCLLYPFGKDPDGYGISSINGKSVRVNRFVCRVAHGAPPSVAHQAAHRCGVRACVNKRHLRWATPSANQLDRIGHGTHIRGQRHPDNKLTPRQVLAIRKSAKPYKYLADKYGITSGMVGHIKFKRAWAWL